MNAYLYVIPVIFATALTAAGNGMMATFVPIRLDGVGVSEDAVGAVVTAYAVGMLLGCVFSGHVIRRVGHIRAFATFAAAGVITTLFMSAWVAAPSWLVLRLGAGFFTTAMFITAQSWLNEVSSSERRGRIMALFYLSYTVSLGIGALIISRIPVDTSAAFLVHAGLYAASVIPIALTKLEKPAPPERIAVHLREVYRISPAGLVGAFVAGALGMTLLGVGPMYGTAIGLEAQEIAVLMAALQGGNLAIQWPMGWLSDRMDRRFVIATAALAVMLLSLAILGVGEAALVLLVLLFGVWGGMAESIYAISTAHANDRTEAGDYVVVSSTILVVWATGSTVGPMLATASIKLAGPPGIWFYFIAVSAGYAVFVAWRLMQREEPPSPQEGHFHTVPSAPQIPEWNPYWHEEEEPDEAAR